MGAGGLGCFGILSWKLAHVIGEISKIFQVFFKTFASTSKKNVFDEYQILTFIVVSNIAVLDWKADDEESPQ